MNLREGSHFMQIPRPPDTVTQRRERTGDLSAWIASIIVWVAAIALLLALVAALLGPAD